jgi:hypothetical protein
MVHPVEITQDSTTSCREMMVTREELLRTLEDSVKPQSDEEYRIPVEQLRLLVDAYRKQHS